MKFSVLNPTEENIRETLLNDQLGRNEELRQFVRLLNSIDGNCTIALDGDWGSGKTFFVKQAQMIIDSFNEYKNKKAISDLRQRRRLSVLQSGLYQFRQIFCHCFHTWSPFPLFFRYAFRDRFLYSVRSLRLIHKRYKLFRISQNIFSP